MPFMSNGSSTCYKGLVGFSLFFWPCHANVEGAHCSYSNYICILIPFLLRWFDYLISLLLPMFQAKHHFRDALHANLNSLNLLFCGAGTCQFHRMFSIIHMYHCAFYGIILSIKCYLNTQHDKHCPCVYKSRKSDMTFLLDVSSTISKKLQSFSSCA